jgi:hypothetical protein
MATLQRILVTVLLGASCAYACTIKESDDEDDDSIFDDDDDDDDEPQAGTGARAGSAGTGGRSGSAGSATFGGRVGSAGSAGRGGTTGAGGSNAGTAGKDDGVPDDLACDGRQGKTPAASCEFTDGDDRYKACLSCLSSSCCSELKQCYATDPTDACAYGGPDNGTEYTCYIECLVKAAKDSGIDAYDPEDPMRCAIACGTPKDGLGKACSTPLIADSTNVLLSCMHTNCEPECIDDLVAK